MRSPEVSPTEDRLIKGTLDDTANGAMIGPASILASSSAAATMRLGTNRLKTWETGRYQRLRPTIAA